jgi:hypothetical protein
MAEYIGIYEAIIEQASGDLLLFFIIAGIVLVVFVAPLYYAVLKDRKAQREHERESRQQIIDVVKENSEVIGSLKITLDNSGTSFVKALERVHERLNEQNAAFSGTLTDVAQLNTKMTSVLENQREMSSKINKIFIMASGGKLPTQMDGGA